MKRGVQPAEVVGRWVMTNGTVKDLADIGHSAAIDPQQHTITLRQDGTCHFHTFPSAWSVGGGGAEPLIDRQCRWELRDSTGRQRLVLFLAGEAKRSIGYKLAEENSQLVLWQHARDPDEWRYIEYQRR